MTRFNCISPAALMRLLGTPSAPVLIDVCIEEDAAEDPFLLPTAFRWPHRNIASLVPKLQGRKAVVICQKGLKLSQGAAAVLRSHGVAAEALQGGNLGWREAELPRLPMNALPQDAPGSLWVTRHRPRIDRIACPWLIRRFVDPQARFLYVSPGEVLDVAEKFDGIAFDAKGARFNHDGALCTFDVLLRHFELQTQPLLDMARVVRGADTNAHSLAPEAAGLLALSVGLSRSFHDDLEQLDAGMILYDALFRWARDGQTEGHASQERLL